MVLSFVGGCALSDPATDSDVPTPMTETAARISPNGPSFTGITDRISPNGPSAAGTTLNGIDPRGRSASGAALTASTKGSPLSGASYVGSTWSGHLSDGKTLALRIDAAQSAGDVWSYQVSALVSGAWQSLCVDAAGNPSFADSVNGTWNLQQGVAGGGAYQPGASDFTFACRGSSIAKCVELGYKPWLGYDAELAACVRALRADYCGDGTSYTVAGTDVNLYDDVGVEPDTNDWTIEAAWTADGAACVTSAQATRFAQVAHQTPSCWGAALKAKTSCGAEFTGSVQIITELPPR